jgi:Tfp pilus assembly protein PilN
VTGRPAAITINFARTDFGLIRQLRQVLIAVIVLLAILAGALLWIAKATAHQGAAAEQRVRDLAASAEKLRPALEERQQLVKNLGAMSGLIEARRHSWTQFLSGIEAAFPAGIALSKVDFNPRDLTAALEGSAQSPEALSNLMIGLQRSRSFRNPQLKHQSMEKGSLSFNVAVSYQEHGVAGPAPDTDRKPGN